MVLSSFCNQDGGLNIGTISAKPSNGLELCDGAFLEIEVILYITDNVNFVPSVESVYNTLSTDEFISLNVGTLDININNEFPGGGLPLTTVVINEFTSGS